MRECETCTETHKQIFYRRLTNITSFDVYSNLKLWLSDNNNMSAGDFILTSTLQDAIQIQNIWQFCNYDDTLNQVGAFRDCGPDDPVGWEWTPHVRARFSIFIGDGM